ncbi:SH3 domain-containing protein [Azospirillum halopraeferens]|uniref:SH3 domain-containing protein n=1 Tax=Azospirillum halopraeferens TaxID=34010 RepID=UPI000401132E|nr:SH3 domain-containing protein [Azospirillum halopraeferens]
MARHPIIAALILLAATLAVAGPAPARAQSPVAVGAPLLGEVVLNRDVEVRIAPDQNARIVQTLKRGRALNALGTPRGTTWTQVAIGGSPIGYVPMDSLDPVHVPRPYTGPAPAGGGSGAAAGTADTAGGGPAAALVPRNAWDNAVPRGADWAGYGVSGLQGYVVATRAIGVTELLENRKRQSFTLRKGEVVGLLDVTNGRLTLSMPGRGKVVAGMAGFTGVAGAYPMPGVPPLGTGPHYVAKLGEFVSYGEGLRAWQEFIDGPGMEWRSVPPMVWPVFRGGGAVYEMGIGPFSAAQIDGACGSLARRGRDCVIAELAVF